MKIEIRAQGFDLTQALHKRVLARMRAGLGRTAARVRGVAVSLRDVNGPRGGADKRCQVEIEVDDLPRLVVKHTDADMYRAIDRSFTRAAHALRRLTHKQRARARRRGVEALPAPA